MSDFNWEDYENQDDDLFSNEDNDNENDLFGLSPMGIDKRIFFSDIQRGGPVPIDPIEYEALFGTLSSNDWDDLVDTFFTLYHQWGMNEITLLDNWGLDWVWGLLKHCERKEEYELCSIVKELIQNYQLHGLIGGQKIKLEEA